MLQGRSTLSAEWRVLARKAGWRILGSDIVVVFSAGRQQKVTVDETGPQAIRLWSVILGPSATANVGEGHPLEYAWERNRLSDLIGFTLDTRGRLIGESWIPVDGMTSEVFSLHLEELARVCDWHELRLTGTDVY